MLDCRLAQPSDMQMIVKLHISLSQSTYADILPESYLRDVVPNEKQELWARRFAASQSDRVIVVATSNGNVEGFCCFLLKEETEFGTYLHNLYVSSDYQGRGVAKLLLQQAINVFSDERKGQPVHLLVFAKNTKAVAMYDRLAGKVIERSEVVRSGNPVVELVRYQWSSADELIGRLGR